MDKWQGLHSFWSQFGLTAYDEASVPTGDDAPPFPYITYNAGIDTIGNEMILQASIWYRSSSWAQISQKADEISKYLYENEPVRIKIDNGYVWIKRGQPFAQRMRDESDDMIRRIYIVLIVEYLTAY